MERLGQDIIDDFTRITKYDVSSFLNEYVDFVENDYGKIINYFSGLSDINPTTSLKNLSSLIAKYKDLIDVLVLNESSFNNYKYWILTEYIEDIGARLETADNTSRWLRSSSTKNGYRRNPTIELMLAQGQTLEDIERVKLGNDNFADDWVETAMQNELREEDYDQSGGTLIKVVYANRSAIFLNSVVDNIDTDQKTYGLDVDRDIKIESDDLVVKQYADTIVQSAEILSSLKQGDDPSFPDRGLSRTIIGSNIAGVSYPIIFRQLAANFSTDDSFKSFSIIDIKREQDAVIIEAKIESKAGGYFDKQIQL